MSRSRVQTRISLRSVFAEDAAPLAALAETLAEPEGEDRWESGFSGEVAEPRCFWSERSILVTVLFIAWASRRAPVAISFFAQKATGHARPSTGKILAHPRAFSCRDHKQCGESPNGPCRSRGSRFLAGKSVVYRGERGNHRGLRAKDQPTERCLAKTMDVGALDLRLGPAALRADGQNHGRSNVLPF